MIRLHPECRAQTRALALVGEINHDPFLLAAEHASRLEIGAGIALAFAPSPMTVANLDWDLQDYSRDDGTSAIGVISSPEVL